MPSRVAKQSKSAVNGSLFIYAALSAACFLLGVGLLVLMIWKVETLARFGLTGELFYLVLIPIGISAAGFLFGVLRSTAIYRGTQWGGTLELGGPIVAAVLVVLGGFALPPPAPGSFSMTVFVHGPGGRQDTIVLGKGRVVLDLEGNRRYEAIDEKGAAYFPGIPSTFLDQEVPVSVDAEGFESADQGSLVLRPGSIYLSVRKKGGTLSGFVTDARGQPIANAEIDVEGASTKTETSGWFKLTIPGERMKGELTLIVRAMGFRPQTLTAVPGSNDLQIQLRQR